MSADEIDAEIARMTEAGAAEREAGEVERAPNDEYAYQLMHGWTRAELSPIVAEARDQVTTTLDDMTNAGVVIPPGMPKTEIRHVYLADSESPGAQGYFDPATNSVTVVTRHDQSTEEEQFLLDSGRFKWKDDVADNTLAHEYGHWLDFNLGRELSRTDPFLTSHLDQPGVRGFLDAVKHSPEWQAWIDWRDAIVARNVNYRRSADRILGYTQDPSEVMARAFAQYIAETGSPHARTAMAERIAELPGPTNLGGVQWSAEGFAPIKAALINMLKLNGVHT